MINFIAIVVTKKILVTAIHFFFVTVADIKLILSQLLIVIST
jgi:hypothetical protein